MKHIVKDIINSVYQVSTPSLEMVLSIAKYETLDKGELLIEKGKRNNKEYFVLDGICKSFLLNPEGNEITISFFTPKSIISPYTTRIKDQLSMINIRALTKLKVAAIDATAFEQLMIENLEIRNFGNSVLRNELMQKVEKEIGLASLTAKERLQILREKYPLLENMVPHTDIASYLGITNISLSRLRKAR